MLGKILGFIITILMAVGILGLVYFIVAGLTYLICLAFNLPWSWLTALGVYAVILLIKLFFGRSGRKE